MGSRLAFGSLDSSEALELKTKLRLLEGRVAVLTADLGRRDDRIEALQAEVAEAWRVAAANERTAKSVKGSISWKLTAPMRECRRAATRILSRLFRLRDEPGATRPRASLREGLRSLERGVRRCRKSLAARLSRAAGHRARPTPRIEGRAKEIHLDLIRAMRARRTA